MKSWCSSEKRASIATHSVNWTSIIYNESQRHHQALYLTIELHNQSHCGTNELADGVGGSVGTDIASCGNSSMQLNNRVENIAIKEEFSNVRHFLNCISMHHSTFAMLM
jgi:hypothetical protein